MSLFNTEEVQKLSYVPPKNAPPRPPRKWPTPCKGCNGDGLRNNSWNHCLDCEAKNEKKLADRKAAMRRITPEQAQQIKATAFQMGIEVREDPDPEETGLKYPNLRFPYEAIQPGSILLKLVDKACEGGLSPGLVVPSILTLVSAIPKVHKMDGARINQQTTLLALVGAGKDTAIDRSLEVCGLNGSDGEEFWTSYSPSGERSISTLIGDTPGTKEQPGRIPGPNTFCIVTYELQDTLNKAKGDSSSVMEAMKHYFDHNRKVYSDSKSRTKQTVDCRLSWLTALPVGDIKIDESEYRRAFGENSLQGTSSRMLFGFSEERFDRRKTRNWTVPHGFNNFDYQPVEGFDNYVFGEEVYEHKSYMTKWREAVVVGWADGIEQLYLDWNPKQNLSGRDTYHAQKIAILCAIINGHKLIEHEDWLFAVAFMDWQTEIRLTFAPGRSRKITQGEFNEIIIKEMEKRTQKLILRGKNTKSAMMMIVDEKKQYFIRWRGMSNDGDWLLFGLDPEKTIDALVRNGKLVYKINFTEASKMEQEKPEVDKKMGADRPRVKFLTFPYQGEHQDQKTVRE